MHDHVGNNVSKFIYLGFASVFPQIYRNTLCGHPNLLSGKIFMMKLYSFDQFFSAAAIKQLQILKEILLSIQHQMANSLLRHLISNKGKPNVPISQMKLLMGASGIDPLKYLRPVKEPNL